MICVSERSVTFNVSKMEEATELMENIKKKDGINITSYSVCPSYEVLPIEVQVRFVESDRTVDINSLRL